MTTEAQLLIILHERNTSRELDQHWYADARREARKRATALGVPLNRYLGVVAATSPLTAWRTRDGAWPNLDAADRAFNGTFRGLPPSVARAKRIIAGEQPTRVLGTSKTGQFYRNLTGLDRDAVTIDGHMLRALGRSYHATPGPREYARLADAVREAAGALDIAPHELQASVWAQIKREQGSPNTIAA